MREDELRSILLVKAIEETDARKRFSRPPGAEDRTAEEVAQLLSPLVSRATREVLERLYPEARELFG